MVDPGHPVVELVGRHLAVLGEQACGSLDAVAKAHHPQARQGCAPGEDGHWVGVLQDQGRRAQVSHVLDQAVEDSEVAQPTEDPTGSEGVTHTLAHAEPLGHGYVGVPLVEPTHLDGDDHVVGSSQCLAAISGGDDPHRRFCLLYTSRCV